MAGFVLLGGGFVWMVLASLPAEPEDHVPHASMAADDDDATPSTQPATVVLNDTGCRIGR
jgi:hypothetical protein